MKMFYKKEFESKHLYFIKVNESLIEDYLSMMNNPNISKYLSFKNKVYTYENELEWVKEKLENDSIIFSIIEKESDKFVGNIEVMDDKNNIADIGIVITEKMQDKHYGTEALKFFIDYCLNNLKYENVELSVYSHNKRAIHCYEKLGFVEFKREYNVGKYENKLVDDIYMKYISKGDDPNE